jgi:hypothetical protein
MNLSSMIKSMEATSSKGPPLEVDDLKDGICIINSAGIMMTTNAVRGVKQLLFVMYSWRYACVHRRMRLCQREWLSRPCISICIINRAGIIMTTNTVCTQCNSVARVRQLSCTTLHAIARSYNIVALNMRMLCYGRAAQQSLHHSSPLVVCCMLLIESAAVLPAVWLHAG